MIRTIIIFLFGTVIAAAGADDGVTLRFNFYYGDTKIANTTETLMFGDDGKTYEINSTAEAIGLAKILHGDVIIRSAGTVDDTLGLLMTTYYSQRGRSDLQTAKRNGNILSLQRGDETRQETLTAPVFDYLTAAYRSYVLGMPSGGDFNLTNGWRLRDYTYTVGEEKNIETDLGMIRAIPLTRTSERGERKIWLAPDYGYLPVRLYIDDKGHVFRTVVTEIILSDQR